MAPKRRLSSTEEDLKSSATRADLDIYVSDPIHDRQSIFVAHYSPTASAKALQSHPDFHSADHRIAAWRTPSKQKVLLPDAPALYDAGSDDDGEKYAGAKLLKVMEALKVGGAVVVARWYGGIMLGPVRFSHIENCARQAIKAYLAAQAAGQDEASKRRKVENEERERKRLVEELPERDASIATLRQLLAEKKGEGAGGSQQQQQKSPMKGPNYGTIPLEALRRLDKARDATIAFLLKSIDEAEKKAEASGSQSTSVVSQEQKPG